jgi:hypothetical protein
MKKPRKNDCGASLCVIKKPRKNEEAKARYRAVKIQPQWVETPGKQTNNNNNTFLVDEEILRIF